MLRKSRGEAKWRKYLQSVMHLNNNYNRLFYVYNAKNEYFDIFKKMNSKVQKWI